MQLAAITPPNAARAITALRGAQQVALQAAADPVGVSHETLRIGLDQAGEALRLIRDGSNANERTEAFRQAKSGLVTLVAVDLMLDNRGMNVGAEERIERFSRDAHTEFERAIQALSSRSA